MKNVLLFSLHCLGIVLSQPYFVPVTTDCKLTKAGREYAGPLNTTRSRLTCQRWDSNYPQSHPYRTSTLFPDGNASAAGNRCRNPDSGYDDGLWCYTTTPNRRWELCDIAFCECKMPDDMFGVRYQGRIRSTRGGRSCRPWSSQSPTPHPFTQNRFFPDGSVYSAYNYCRNPNASRPDGPWCYTTVTSVEWEYCRVPVCNYSLPVTSTKVQTSRWTTSIPQTKSSAKKFTSPSTTIHRTTRPLTTIPRTTRPPTTSLKTTSSRTTGLQRLTTYALTSKTRPPSTTTLRTTPAITTSPKTSAASTTVSKIKSQFTTSPPSSSTSLRSTSPPIVVLPATVPSSAVSSKTVQPSNTLSQASTRLRNMRSTTSPVTTRSETMLPYATSSPSTNGHQSTVSLKDIIGPESESSPAANKGSTTRSALDIHSSTKITVGVYGTAAKGTRGETESVNMVAIVVPIVIGAFALISIIVIIFLWKRTRLFQSCGKRNADSTKAPDGRMNHDAAPIDNDYQSLQKTGNRNETLDMTDDPSSLDGYIAADDEATYLPMYNLKHS